MTALDFYRQQSQMSDPGAYAHLYDALPDDLTSLCKVVRGIYFHYMAGSGFNYVIPPERKKEVDLRRIDLILKRVQELDAAPLTEKRPVEKRVVGCCRDAALLLCSMLRHKGIPARVRIGFATYIRLSEDPYHVDHTITEYHDGTRWKQVDAEQNDYLIQHNRIDFDVQDIPRDRFIVGGRAWQMVANEEAEASEFGDEPGSFFSGKWAIRDRLVADLAALNKDEYLLWDVWGLRQRNHFPNKEERALLEKIADLTEGDVPDFEAVRTAYKDKRLKAPKRFMTYSPAVPFHETTL